MFLFFDGFRLDELAEGDNTFKAAVTTRVVNVSVRVGNEGEFLAPQAYSEFLAAEIRRAT